MHKFGGEVRAQAFTGEAMEQQTRPPWEMSSCRGRMRRRSRSRGRTRGRAAVGGAAAGPSRRRRRARAGRVRVHGGEFLPLDEEKMGAVHGWIRL